MRIRVEQSTASEELLSALVGATAAALSDTPQARLKACGMLETRMGSQRLPVRMLGLSACLAIEVRRMTLVCGSTLRAVRRWWVACAEEGWIEYCDIDEAMHELARASVSAENVEAPGSASSGASAQAGLDYREHRAGLLLELLRHELDAARARAG